MNTAPKLAAYGLILAAVFAASLGTGVLLGTSPGPVDPGHGDTPEHSDTGGHAEPAGELKVPAGLQIAQDGYRLELTTGEATRIAFRIHGPDGEPLTAYAREHDKDLHLIVVRRDLTGYRHLHPTMAPDGTWSTPLVGVTPGQYKVFADFRPAARDTGLTLGADLAVAGQYRPEALPEPGQSATVDGYQVALAGELKPGKASPLTLTVTKDGEPVTDLDPYLGAYGHLVALRDGDLAYLHVHAEDQKPGPELKFVAEVPSEGAYRLFLDFQHDGVVRTAAFTQEAHGHG